MKGDSVGKANQYFVPPSGYNVQHKYYPWTPDLHMWQPILRFTLV